MKLNKSTLKQMIKEEMTKLVELERLKRLQARDKMKKLEAQLAAVKKAQAEADRGMLDDPAGMGGAAYMDTDYRDSLKRQEAAIAAEIKKLKDSGEAEIKKPTEKPTEKPQNRYMTIGGVPVYGEREYYPTGVYESKKIKSTLKQMIREEIKLMEDDFDDLNPGYDAAVGSITAAFAMNKDLPVDEIAKIAVENLMRSYNITLKDEEKVVMPPEEYERLKMPGRD